MKANLMRVETKGVWHVVDGKRIEGPHKKIWGDVSGIRGDVNECGLSDAERKAGVDVMALVKKETP